MEHNKQPKDWREARRIQAWRLKEKGWQPSKIAEALGVTQSPRRGAGTRWMHWAMARGAVSQWFNRAKTDGVEALYSRKSSGRPPELHADKLEQLPALLAKGAEAYGFRGDFWTRPRVATVIKKAFGVSYTPQHVGNLLRKIGWSRQKPVERASQRNEVAIERWRTAKWAETKKKPKQKSALSSL